MNKDIQSRIRSRLKKANKSDEQIDNFLSDLGRYLEISDASKKSNISRNVPLKYEGDTYNHLTKIRDAAKELVKALSQVDHDKELKQRLYIEWDIEFSKTGHAYPQSIVQKIYEATNKTLEYQRAQGPDAEYGGHLRPEYKGKNTSSHHDIESVLLLKHVMERHFPDIRPSKKGGDTNPFREIAAALINKSDPNSAIKKALEIAEASAKEF